MTIVFIRADGKFLEWCDIMVQLNASAAHDAVLCLFLSILYTTILSFIIVHWTM